MSKSRAASVRGTRTPGTPGKASPDQADFLPEDIADPCQPRAVVSYALARRAALQAMRTGRAFDSDHCDAHPNLLRAAKYHGEPAAGPCPVCRRRRMVEVTWVFGAQLGSASGSARARAELATMAHEHGRFQVYVVEVCPDCNWNFMILTFALGDGVPRRSGR